MFRRVFSIGLAAALLMTVLVSCAALADNGYIMFVYTEDQGTLNVRSSMNTGNNVIGALPFGTPVHVYNFYSGWAMIDYNNSNAFVMSRYLVQNQPGSVTPAPAPVPTPGTSLEDINREFKSAVRVYMPYTVVARPARASGWVNLRWAPSTKTEVITTCRQGKELTVIAELQNWYQVQDPMTGMVGFISRSYVRVK